MSAGTAGTPQESTLIHPATPMVWFGGDYNPDQWDDATLEEDIRLFQLAGVNLVTLPVFAWARLEPREGEYDFLWLDHILERLWLGGIHVCLSTPTAAQPAWMSKKYPEILPVDRAGRKRTHGMRVFFCVNSAVYRERAAAIARAMAERYSDFPGLAGWHVGNEYGTYCYCPHCQSLFRTWLQRRYGSVDALNSAWNLSFWGRTVGDFDEVMLPTELNDDDRFYPQIMLDYMRFVTDSTIACFRNEYEILKAHTPELPVFTNISGFIKKLDQFKLVSSMDTAGWDNYPSPGDPRSLVALKLDIMRGLRGGKPFLLTEQSPNQQNWQPYNRLKRPGEVRLLSYQAMAHGADSCLFFQMRQSRAGVEMLHGALISHAGRADTRVFRECAQLGGELGRLGDAFIGGTVHAEVGLLFDWDNWWAVELSSGPSRDLAYLEQVRRYYRPFYEQNIPVDVLPVNAELSKYRILLAPLLYMVKPGMRERLEDFVRAGGILVCSMFSGIAGENAEAFLGGYPGPLADLLGIWVEECDALLPTAENTIRILPQWTAELTDLRAESACRLLCDVVHTEGAEALAVYGNDFYAGAACLTRNRYGNGWAYYLATDPEDAFMDGFAAMLGRQAGISAPCRAQPGVEVLVRRKGAEEILFALNHNAEEASVELGARRYTDLLTGMEHRGELKLPGLGVAVLRGEP